MYNVRSAEYRGIKPNSDPQIQLALAHVDCDTAADLPAYDAIAGTEFIMGSTALIIATGEIKMLNSAHEWVAI